MSSSEKVIKGLEICSKIGWCEGNNGCPYWREDLQGQEQIDLCKEMLSGALELLKEKERKTGKWLPCKASIFPYGYDVKCSECGLQMGSTFGYRYCPKCGAKMEDGTRRMEEE